MNDPGPQTGKLSIGVIVDALPLQAWSYEVLEQILEHDLARVTYVAAAPVDPRPGLVGRLFLHLYSWLDRLFLPSRPSAFAKGDASRHMDRLDMFDLGSADRLPPGSVLESVDLVINLSTQPLADLLTTRTSQKSWSLPIVLLGARSGLKEVYERQPVVAVELIETSPDSRGPEVLRRSCCATDRFSLGRTRNRVFWKTAALVIRELENPHGSNQRAESGRDSEPSIDAADPGHSEHPATVLLAKVAARLIKNGLGKLLRRRQWQLMWRADSGLSEEFATYRELQPPPGRQWADPCVVTRAGRHYVFLEQIVAGNQNGHVAVLELKNESVAPVQPRIALEEAYHLSHPFIFEWAGENYMVPESAANQTVDLYRCLEFPHRWEFQKSLLSGVRAVDATFLEHEGRWWMFVAMAVHTGATTRDELFLYSNRRPIDDDWQPHRLNPVVTDVRCARPAGRIYERDGKLVRPAQDCSHRYGYGIRLMEIRALDAERYEEVEIGSYTPDWDRNVIAMHTIDQGSEVTVLDAKRSTFRLV